MEKLVENLDGTFYRVNESVPFKADWFDYLFMSPLPSYYSVISVDVLYNEFTDVTKLLEILSYHFAFVTIVKYMKHNCVVLQIVTNKPLQVVIDIINRIDICKVFC